MSSSAYPGASLTPERAASLVGCAEPSAVGGDGVAGEADGQRRRAVDLLFAGRWEEAAEAYRCVFAHHPEQVVAGALARELSARGLSK